MSLVSSYLERNVLGLEDQMVCWFIAAMFICVHAKMESVQEEFACIWGSSLYKLAYLETSAGTCPLGR